MYKIIGADQREYGPVTGDQIRQWIAEGRVNAQTRIQVEGAAEWKQLSAFPEFADASGAPPLMSPPLQGMGAGGGREAALQAVRGPGIGLMVTAVIGLVMVAIGLVVNGLTLAGLHIGMQQIGDPQLQKIFNAFGGGLGIVQDIIGAAVGVVVLMGALKMQKLQSYQFVFTASILAMLPCISPCCILGLPCGIWALVVLNSPEVKSQFG
jgi:hypothetical protein